MLKKLFWSIIMIPLCAAQAFAQGSVYDQQINEYINQERWFDAKQLYDAHRHEMSDLPRLISASVLDTYFNKPAEGVAHTEELIEKYSEMLGPTIVFKLLILKNLAEMAEYAKVDSLVTSILTHDARYIDNTSRIALLEGQRRYRRMQASPPKVIDRSQAGTPNSLAVQIEDDLFYLNIGFGTKRVKTLFDTGAEYTGIDESLARELGVVILQDSLMVSPSTGFLKMGIIDSLQIGSVTIRNEICYIFPDGYITNGRERLSADLGVFRMRAMLGMPTMKRFASITLDVEKKTATFDMVKRAARGTANNFMLIDNQPYLRFSLNGVPATMHWDTGMNSTPLVTSKFYSDHHTSFPAPGAENRDHRISFQGIYEYAYRELTGLNMEIGSQKIALPELRIIDSSDKSREALSVRFDGRMNNFLNVRRIKIDFANMCISVE